MVTIRGGGGGGRGGVGDLGQGPGRGREECLRLSLPGS